MDSLLICLSLEINRALLGIETKSSGKEFHIDITREIGVDSLLR